MQVFEKSKYPNCHFAKLPFMFFPPSRKRGSDNNHITLVSENEKYEPFELHLSKVNALAIVVGVLRLE